MATTNRTAKPNVKPPIVKSKSIASKSSKTASEAGRTDKFELASVRSQIDAIRQTRCVLELEADGTISYANERMLTSFGYSDRDLVGLPFESLANSGNRDTAAFKQLMQNLVAGEVQSGEYSFVNKEGKQVWLDATFTPVLDSNDQVCKIVGIAKDISDSKALLAEVEELRVRVDIMNLTSIVSVADLKGDILSVNQKFLDVSKYSEDELIGQPQSTTRHPDVPKSLFKEMWSTIGRGKMFRGVVKNRAKDGTPYYVDAVIAPIMGENGKPKKYIGVRYDITEAEIERQNAQGVLAAIDASYAFIEFDTKGVIQKANENFLSTLGYRLEEVTGKHHRMFVEPSIANSPAYTQFWTDLSDGKSKIDVFKRIAKDGREVWIQAVYAPVKDEMGRVFKVVKIATDITQSVVANEELKSKNTTMIEK